MNNSLRMCFLLTNNPINILIKHHIRENVFILYLEYVTGTTENSVILGIPFNFVIFFVFDIIITWHSKVLNHKKIVLKNQTYVIGT